MCQLLHCTPRITSSSLLTSTWFLTHHIPLHMSLIDVTYARSHPPGYLLWFHLRFLPLNSYHILMLTVLLTLSVPLWCLVLILSAPYLPGQPVPLLLPLGYLSFSANIVLNRTAERVWRKSQNPTDLHFYRSLLSDFSANVSTAKRTYYHDKINNSPISRMLFKTFSSLLCPPPPPPSSTQTADNFGTFFINKITNLTAQFSTPQSVKHILPANINSFLQTSFHSLRQKSLNPSFPVILLLVCLILFHLISFKLFLLQLFLHSLTSLTHPFTLEFSLSI